MIKKSKDGTEYYYYYKKKVGRHKKRGRKPNPKKKTEKWQEPWDFKIIKCTFNKQDAFIGVYHNLTEVEKAKQLLEEENSQIIFPVCYVNSSNLVKDRYNTTEYKSEYLVLKRIKNDEDRQPVKLRDDYGRLVEHTTNSDTWCIYDKFPCLKEETFWVYGYNPQSDRKTYRWIYNNIIVDVLGNDTTVVIQCFVYKNKVIFRYDADAIEFIICKNTSDAIRLYNKLNDDVKQNKIKRTYFMGQVSTYSERGKLLIKELTDLTGWNLTKIRQKAT